MGKYNQLNVEFTKEWLVGINIFYINVGCGLAKDFEKNQKYLFIYLLIKSYGPLKLAYNYNFRVVCKAARALNLLTNCSVLKV
jgi:hypothetical protein